MKLCSLPTAWQIILGATLLSICLGVAMDLVTANVAVEYFTVHHPKVVESKSPWVMALVWGVGASWWAGLILGAILAWINSRLNPSLPARRVLRMIGISCGVLWVLMMLVLVAVYSLGAAVPAESRSTNFEHDRRLVAVAVTHATEYVLAAVAAVIVAFRMRRVSRSIRA